MEIFGGFLVILWIAGFFLTIIWFILPFVVFGIKARTDESLARIREIETRLAVIENMLTKVVQERHSGD